MRCSGSESPGKGRSPPPLKNLLTTLINLLAEIEAPLEIVLDDYHLIDFEEVHEGVRFFIDHLPPLVHVTIISRQEMPFFGTSHRDRMG